MKVPGLKDLVAGIECLKATKSEYRETERVILVEDELKEKENCFMKKQPCSIMFVSWR